MASRSSVSPHHSLYLELPCEIRRIWKCPWPHWAVSEVSGAFSALLIKIQSAKEIPGITRWGTALTHPPKPQCGQEGIGGCDLPQHCQGRWDSSANPSKSLPASKPTAMESLEMPLDAVHGTLHTGGFSNSPRAEANSCFLASHPFISEEGCERSSFLLCCDNLPRAALGMFQGWHLSPALSQELSRWG